MAHFLGVFIITGAKHTIIQRHDGVRTCAILSSSTCQECQHSPSNDNNCPFLIAMVMKQHIIPLMILMLVMVDTVTQASLKTMKISLKSYRWRMFQWKTMKRLRHPSRIPSQFHRNPRRHRRSLEPPGRTWVRCATLVAGQLPHLLRGHLREEASISPAHLPPS